MKNIIMNEEFFGEVANYVYDKTMLKGDAEDLQNVFQNTLEYMAKKAAEEREEGEEVNITFPGFISMKCSERDGNFGLGFTAEEELKKRIKDDAEKDILDDEDDE